MTHAHAHQPVKRGLEPRINVTAKEDSSLRTRITGATEYEKKAGSNLAGESGGCGNGGRPDGACVKSFNGYKREN